MPSSTIDVLSRHLEHVTIDDPSSNLPTLAEVLDAVPDPRHRRGRRYRLGPLLALSLLAVLSGATSLAKITRFIAGYDPDLRTQLGLPATVRLAASTLGRLLARLDGDAFDTATCAYLAAITTGHPRTRPLFLIDWLDTDDHEGSRSSSPHPGHPYPPIWLRGTAVSPVENATALEARPVYRRKSWHKLKSSRTLPPRTVR
ncbi:transposase family protein [Nonomuraea sp. B1E8]|uniref:transposase family protein n=1 Tax=Nonomuraea sp. B1E8 TaxID=3153575 RepID=UPI00325CC6A2